MKLEIMFMHVHMHKIQIVELYANISVLKSSFYIEMFIINKGTFIKPCKKRFNDYFMDIIQTNVMLVF